MQCPRRLIAAAVLLLGAARATAAVTTELYTDRAQFEARLQAGGIPTGVIGFDDIAVPTASSVVAFAADRYAASGIVITGTDGQFVSGDFGYGVEFSPSSPPNIYAPGPMSTNSTAGGFETDVTFVDGGAARAVAGFGCVFIDTDYPGIGPSSFTVFDVANAAFGSTGLVTGPNGSHLFRGLVAVDDATNEPVPAIGRVHVVSGNEWVGRDVDEDVALDDFVFGPALAVTSTTTSTSTTSTTAPPGCVRAETLESIGCRLDALAVDVKGAPDLGRLKKSLAGLLDKARTKHAAARSLLTGPKRRKAKAALKVVQSRVKAFTRLLRSRKAKRVIVDPTRRALLGRGEELVDDLRSVRGSLKT